MLKKLIGDRRFYRMVLTVAVPMMLQQGMTQFVSLLDNLMIGSLSTESMSAVSIVNQFMFIFFLLVFGGLSGAGIFTAQYHGKGDKEGEVQTFRFKLITALALSVLGIAVFLLFGDSLISLFLHESESGGDIALTLSEAKKYMAVTLCGLLPFAFAQVYTLTLRETGQTVVPMFSSIAAIATNFVLNLILIFGLLGFPALGVVGAAIATLISRFVELLVLVLWSHTHKARCVFLQGAFSSFRVSPTLVKQIALRGMPLMANELFWSLGIILRNQCFSTRGLDTVASLNITLTLSDVFSVVYIALGGAIATIVGNMLGAGRIDEARDTSRKMIAFSVACSAGVGLLLAAVSPFFPLLYNTADNIRALATYMLLVTAILMPIHAFSHASYFTVRSGGKVLITLLLDSGFMWGVTMVLCFLLAYATPIDIALLFLLCHGVEILKVPLGYLVLRYCGWARQIVSEEGA